MRKKKKRNKNQIIIKCWSSIECNKCARSVMEQREGKKMFQSFARDHDSWWITFIYIFFSFFFIWTRSFASIGNIVGTLWVRIVSLVVRLQIKLNFTNQSLYACICTTYNGWSLVTGGTGWVRHTQIETYIYVINKNKFIMALRMDFITRLF